MLHIGATLSDPWALLALGLVVAGLVLATFKWPSDPASRKYSIWALWAACFGILAVWAMHQQALVIAGGLVPSADQPVPITIKGTVRYVAQDLAYRHDSSMWLLLVCGLGFVAAYKLARVGDEA